MIAIIDYGVGNLGSIFNMFRKAGAEAIVSSDAAAVARADRLVLPGVGSFDNGMRNLAASGLVPVIHAAAVEGGRPLLGICLGMQLLGNGSEEGTEPGLGWVDSTSARFRFDGSDAASLKVPHMGWNLVHPAVRRSALLDGVADADGEVRFYFLHSYFVRCAQPDRVVGETTHGHPFVSMFEQENIAGVQFHPEKSHRFGLQLFRNFATWAP